MAEEEVAALVVDNGSGMVKAGFAGDDAAELAAVGNQTGGRVFLFLHTDDFHRDHRAFRERGVEFLEAPREEDYGTVAVFRDLYGNKWDLLQLK